MSRGKNKTAKEWRRYKKLEQDNEKLKKEVAKLRKMANSSVNDILANREKEVSEGRPAIKPTCEVCGNEDLAVISMKRADGNFEIKVCRSCGHRSQMKPVKNKDEKKNNAP